MQDSSPPENRGHPGKSGESERILRRGSERSPISCTILKFPTIRASGIPCGRQRSEGPRRRSQTASRTSPAPRTAWKSSPRQPSNNPNSRRILPRSEWFAEGRSARFPKSPASQPCGAQEPSGSAGHRAFWASPDSGSGTTMRTEQSSPHPPEPECTWNS